MPAPPAAVELAALLDAAARARGAAHGVDFRRYASCRALLAALHRTARARVRGRPVSGTVRSSWGYLAKLVDELLTWEQEPDHVANADRRRSSLRRWLRELEACGLLRATVVHDEEGQERGVDVELRPTPELDAEQLAHATTRLSRWRARYGDGEQLAARRSGAILARLAHQRRATAARFAPRHPARRDAQNTSGPPLLGASGDRSGPSDPSGVCEASCGARERAQRPKVTRSPLTDTATATAATSPPTSAGEDGGPEARWSARRAAWQQRVAAADATVAAFVASVAEPLPPLPVLRLALAARIQGLDALTAGEPVAGLSPELLRRLRHAASRWLRWRPPGAPDAAGELLRRAHPGVGLGELVRGFAVDARHLARHARAQQPDRLDAAHRRAKRQRAAILAAWPAWLKRGPDDRLVLDPGGRFLQVHRLPTPAELATPALRRWLRAITALQWYAPAAAIELTDPDGRYTYLPLDTARLTLDGDRTRGPWTSHQPRRQQARRRARRAITTRRRGRRT